MTYLDAAIQVLREARRPLTTRELTEAALRRELISPLGTTPIATMSATLYRHLRDAQKPRIRRDSQPGPARALRGSVRWHHAG